MHILFRNGGHVQKPWQRFSHIPGFKENVDSKAGFAKGMYQFQQRYYSEKREQQEQTKVEEEEEEEATTTTINNNNNNNHNNAHNQNFKKKNRQTTTDPIYFLPETYVLSISSHREAFRKTLEEEKRTGRYRPWVIKQALESQGRGVHMIPPNSSALLYDMLDTSSDSGTATHATDVDSGGSATATRTAQVYQNHRHHQQQQESIVQRYICDELTWFGGQKFDLRFYWMVASVDPLIVLYHDGIVRVGDTVYNETDFNTSTTQQLTNSARNFANRKGNYNVKQEQEHDIFSDALWRRVQEHYEDNKDGRLSNGMITDGDPIRHVRNQLKESIGTTVEAFKDVFTTTTTATSSNHKHEQNQDNNNNDNISDPENLFSLYGADFIIDADLDVYFTEAQAGPDLKDDHGIRTEFHQNLLRPMVNLVEGIAMQQERDAKANILPFLSSSSSSSSSSLSSKNNIDCHFDIGEWEIVYAGDWRYRFEGYERRKDKRGCSV